MQKSNVCAKNFPHDYWKGQNGFWNASQHEIRRTHHKYLVSGKSIVIEVGGNIGDTTQVFPQLIVIRSTIKFPTPSFSKNCVALTTFKEQDPSPD
jgi:hypothetical protein